MKNRFHIWLIIWICLEFGVFYNFSMEGYITANYGRGKQQRCIRVGPLVAYETSPNWVVDVHVFDNRQHWVAWEKNTKFDVEAFLEQTSDDWYRSAPFRVTKTSEYVSKLDIERIVVAINTRWRWNESEDALTHVTIPIVNDVWTKTVFPFTVERVFDANSETTVFEKNTCFWEDE